MKSTQQTTTRIHISETIIHNKNINPKQLPKTIKTIN